MKIRKTYKTHSQNNLLLLRLFWTTMVALIVFSGLYMYFVGQTIFTIAEREHAEDMIVELQTDISELELALIENRRMLTEEYATTRGFVEADEAIFVKRDPDTRLSLRAE